MVSTPKELRTTLVNRIFNDPSLEASNIDVGLDSGTVTIKGLVKNHRQRHQAEEVVSELEDVLHVKTQLVVIPTEKVADAVIAQNILEELEKRHKLEISNLLIEVADGMVTLGGTVPDVAAKVYAYVAAVNASGVLNVLDNVTVVTK